MSTETHRQSSQIQIHSEDMETLRFEDSDVKSLLLLNRVFRVGVDQTGQYLGIETDLGHSSGKHQTRETTRQTGVRRKADSDSEEG